MCGIAGFWLDQSNTQFKWFGQCLATLNERGPDDQGTEVFDDGKLVMGHTRLSIIDISDRGRQPLTNEDRSVWITFNGEIYNYKALRRRLVEQGHSFATDTDTEVIVHAYEEWGTACVRELNGIFAFAIWDGKAKQLFLARDHVGIKPLYFFQSREGFGFASQPKAIVAAPFVNRNVSKDSFRDYLSFGYIPEPGCIFEGIRKLAPGHCMTVSSTGVRIDRYWRIEYCPSISSFPEASEAIESAVAAAVANQLTSDVPVGTLLSGGIDSTLLTGIAHENLADCFRPLRTFTLGFDQQHSDERSFAAVAAKYYGTNHIVEILTADDFLSQLDIAATAFDEPFDPNGPMPATRIAELVRDHDIKVVLGGDGGDELFSGYLRYDSFADYRQKQSGLWSRLRRRFNQRESRRSDIHEYFQHEGACDADLLAEVMPDASDVEWAREATNSLEALYDEHLPPVVACQMMDFNHYLPGHILTKVDRATMHFGVEARVPLLDVNLAELAFSIDQSVNYRKGERKAALKAAAAKHLPAELLCGRKKGFSSPMAEWFNPAMRQWAAQKIENGILVQKGLVRSGAASGLIARSSHRRLRVFWLLLAGELWAEKWLVAHTDRPSLKYQFEHVGRA